MPKTIFKLLALALFAIGAVLILAPSLTSAACVEQGNVCYQASDCCSGLTCFLPEGQESGGCQCEDRTCYYAEFDAASKKCTYAPLGGAPCDLGGGKAGECVDIKDTMECRDYCIKRDCFTVSRDENGDCVYKEAAEGASCDLNKDGIDGDGKCKRGFDGKLWCVSAAGPTCDVCDHNIELQKCADGVIYKCKTGIAWDCWEQDSQCPADRACCNPTGKWCDLCGLEGCYYEKGDLQKCVPGSGGGNAQVYRCAGDNKWRPGITCPTSQCATTTPPTPPTDCYYPPQAPQNAVIQSLTCPQETCYSGETAEIKLTYSVYKETYITKSAEVLKYSWVGLWSENKTESPGAYSKTITINCDNLAGLRSAENNFMVRVADDKESCTVKYSAVPGVVDLNHQGAPPDVTWQWKHVRGDVTEYRLYNKAMELIAVLSPKNVCAGGIGSDCSWQETGIGIGVPPNTSFVRAMQACNANGCNPKDTASIGTAFCPSGNPPYQYFDTTATAIEAVKKAECANISKTSITVNALADSFNGFFTNLNSCQSAVAFKGANQAGLAENRTSWTFNNLEPGKSYQFLAGPSFNAVGEPSGSAVSIECATLSRTCNACGDGFFSNICDKEECNMLGEQTGGCIFIDRTWPLPNLCLEIIDVPFYVQEAVSGQPIAGVLVKVVEGSNLNKEKDSCITDSEGSCSVKLAETRKYTTFVQNDNYECQGSACVVAFTALPGQTIYLKPKEIIRPTETLTDFLVVHRTYSGFSRIPNMAVQVFTSAGEPAAFCQGNGYCTIALAPETDYTAQTSAPGYICAECPKAFHTSGSYMTVEINMQEDADVCLYNVCSDVERKEILFKTYEKPADIRSPVVGAEVKVFFADTLAEAGSCISRDFDLKNGGCEIKLCPYCKYYVKGFHSDYIDYGTNRAFDTFPNGQNIIWLKLTKVDGKEEVQCPTGYSCLSIEKAREKCGLEVDSLYLGVDFSCTTDCKDQCAHFKEESRDEYYLCEDQCINDCHTTERSQYCLDVEGFTQYYCASCPPGAVQTKVSFSVIDGKNNTALPNALVKVYRQRDYLELASPYAAAVCQTGAGGEACTVNLTSGEDYAAAAAGYLMEDGSTAKALTAQGTAQKITLRVLAKEKPQEPLLGIDCAKQYGPDYQCILNPIPLSVSVCPKGLDIQILPDGQYCLEGINPASYCAKCLKEKPPSFVVDPETSEGDVGTSGGTITGIGGNVKIIFPSDAVDEDIIILMKSRSPYQIELDAASSIDKSIANGIIYDLEAIAGSRIIFSFLKPIDVVISYNDSPLIDENSLALASFNELTGQWDVLPSAINKINNTLTAKMTSFSAKAVLFSPSGDFDEPNTAGVKGDVCCDSSLGPDITSNMGCAAGLECGCNPDEECLVGVKNGKRTKARGKAGSCVEQGQTASCSPISAVGAIEDIVKALADLIFYLTLIIAPLIIIIGAYMFLTSKGEPERITKAKKIIIWAVIGLIIIVISKIIYRVVYDIIIGS